MTNQREVINNGAVDNHNIFALHPAISVNVRNSTAHGGMHEIKAMESTQGTRCDCNIVCDDSNLHNMLGYNPAHIIIQKEQI